LLIKRNHDQHNNKEQSLFFNLGI